MNAPSAVNVPSTEQLIGKFQVVNVDKLPINTINNQDDLTPSVSAIADESGNPSRFQMIRVDRNFGRGRWKVNDYEPPENISNVILPPVNTIENEQINHAANATFAAVPVTTTTAIPNVATAMPTAIPADSNVPSSAALAASAASAAAAAANAFQQQQMALKNAPTLVPAANVAPPAGLLHPYPPAPLPNQPYLLPNHHQFGYYPFYPPPYPHYPPSWAAAAAALAASNPYLQPPPPPTALAPPTAATSSLAPTAAISDPIRLTDGAPDMNPENSVMSSTNFTNPKADHLQNAQLAAAAASFLYPTHHSHAPFIPQISSTTSPYATIPSYHPQPSIPTIVPRNQPAQIFVPVHTTSSITTETQIPYPAPISTSPKQDNTKQTIQQPPSLLPTAKPKPSGPAMINGIVNEPSNTTQIADLISSSPLLSTAESNPPSLLSPINVNVTNSGTASLSDIWTYTTSGSPLNLTQTAQTAAVTAAAAIGLLNNDRSQNTEIANEILKELTTPTKQNNTTDIDNKISAAMDLVKMHLLSAVRDEVTELRQQIRILNERISNAEQENAFLRQYVPSEILAQCIPTIAGVISSSDSTNPTTTSSLSSISASSSSQPVLINSISSNPSSIVQQPTSLSINLQPPISTANLPPT